jgi:hypothetical protein
LREEGKKRERKEMTTSETSERENTGERGTRA